ncbi:MAG: formylglycine-generating enzyme family protein [Thermoanaerobaculia bacterium]
MVRSIPRWLPAGVAALALAGCAAREQWTEPVTGMQFVLVPAGRFVMGSPPGERDREAQEVAHPVDIAEPFWVGRYEVTQGEWVRVMGSNPSRFADCGVRCPVEQVSHDDIERFLERLADLSVQRFRLPTEAEWEYACRAGTTTAFAFGEELSSTDANIDDQPGDRIGAPGPGNATVPVGSFRANAWGLHDFHGNVWEWTSDRHCPYLASADDPSCDDLLVIRGGSWHFGADSARCALRYTHAPEDSGPSLGFRLVRDRRPAVR